MGKEKSLNVSRRSFLKGSAVLVGASLMSMEGFLKVVAAQAQGGGDLAVLNYALTLEHLEYAFYRDGLQQFSASDNFGFLSNRPGGDVRTFLAAIRDHEKAHVDTLTAVIQSMGGTPVAEAKYNFAYRDARGFVGVAQALENTGVSAYDGAIASIQSPQLQTAAATIATVEARHAAYLNYLNYVIPFPTAFDTPKTQAQILNIAGQFIVAN